MQLALFEDQTEGHRQPSTAWMLEPGRPLIAVAYGAGRDSTGAIIGLWERGIRPDLLLFSDTGGEKRATYEFISTFNRWLHSVGFPEVQTLNYGEGSKYGSLEDECLRKGILPAIAFGQRSCSFKWKHGPFRKFVNRYEPARLAWRRGGRVVRVIGYEATECNRIRKATTYMAAKPDHKYDNWFPLVEWGWSLKQCVEAIERVGLPVPPKSSCFFCSAMKVGEIEQLALEEPDKFRRALAMESNAQPRLTRIKGLGGRKFAWSNLPCTAPFLSINRKETL